MNGLNCESKKKKSHNLIVSIFSALGGFLLCAVIVVLIFLNTPGFSDLVLLNQYIENFYYGNTTSDDVIDGVLNGYINAIGDKYSAYYNDENSDLREEHLLGVGKGLGINVVKHPDRESIYVVEVYENSPASSAGILKGDEIIAVGGNLVDDIGYTNSVTAMKGKLNDNISLIVSRNNETLNFTVTISDFILQSVFYETIGEYGFIKITAFNTETVAQFKNAINVLTEDNVKGLIFDLRGNGGGTVDSVGQILDVLVPEGDVMTVFYKNGHKQVSLKSDANEILLPMTVLTDGTTASAAELFSATIRDFNKGVLIGSKTYGKGVMQNTFALLDGKTAVFTVAEFKPHSLVSFNDVGLLPDIEVNLTDEQKKYAFIMPKEKDTVIAAAIRWLEQNEEKY